MTNPTRSRLVTLSVCLLCLPLLAANCPTQPDDDDDDDAQAQALAKLWDAYCDLLTRCEPQWGKSFESKAACTAAWNKMTNCELDEVDFVDASGFVVSEGDRCIAWLNGASCDTYVFNEDAPDACAKVFGSSGAAVNQSCEDRSCADGLYCEDSASDGVCAVCRQDAALDQACSEDYPWMPCASGLYCDTSSDTCKALKAVSETCQIGDECQSGYCPAGTCAAPLARDAACTEDDLCAGALVCRGGTCQDRVGTSQSCTDSEQCYLLTHACRQGVCTPVALCELAGIGEACSFGCVAGAYCDSSSGTCQAYTALNQPCSGWSECGPDAYCDWTANVCLAYIARGEPCSSGMCDDESFCDYNATTPVCTAPRANGQDCTYSMECQSSYCDTATSKCMDEPACTMP